MDPADAGGKPWVHVAPIPDDYREPYHAAIRRRAANTRGMSVKFWKPSSRAAFIAESLPSVGGQIVFPPGYLAEVYASRSRGRWHLHRRRSAGRIRKIGRWFWGFEMQGVAPDIVVLGKPMGNGFPLAGVVTTPEIAASFDNGMEFFSTYRRESGRVRGGAGGAGCSRDKKGLQENAHDRGRPSAPCVAQDETSADRRRARSGTVLGNRTVHPRGEEASDSS